jgi:hypothetical protein
MWYVSMYACYRKDGCCVLEKDGFMIHISQDGEKGIMVAVLGLAAAHHAICIRPVFLLHVILDGNRTAHLR